ncbi:hypothetical protein RCOM_0552890 [Ricinus communis]|uniref:Pentatricopeptide repeat-containing protein n=1 Tax=Ricinus communis TaxID=3988 RepID=B9SGH2_RICCO|nr:hypothetical protein RCOM_0552890 [Ricinus communis]
MIGVYFSAGSAAKALKIYKTMKKNSINPSLGTYNVLLAGLEKSGRVCETDNFRKEKRSLMADGNRLSCLPMEEKICDLLFAGSLPYDGDHEPTPLTALGRAMISISGIFRCFSALNSLWFIMLHILGVL